MKASKYYLDNSVESLLSFQKRKYNSKKVKVVDLISTGAICVVAVIMAIYLGKIFIHFPEALNSF
jgi:hypothetical protein